MPRKSKPSPATTKPDVAPPRERVSSPRDIARRTAERSMQPVAGYDREKSRRQTRRASDAADRLLRDLDDVIRQHPRGADRKP